MDPSARDNCGHPCATSILSSGLHQTDPHVGGSCHSACPASKGLKEEDTPLHVKPRSKGWRRLVRNLTPSWFSVNMGTGIVSILLHNLPYNSKWLYWLSVIIFALNVSLFLGFLSISVLRYTLYPRIWQAMIKHPVQSLFLGTFPMGFATIINMIVFVCVPAWGISWVYLAWSLWWIDAAIAMTCCLYLPFVIMAHHTGSELKSMTAVWLLPIVSTIVAAATGAIVADVLPNDQYALITILASYVLWATGLPLAMCVLVMYFQRLTIHKLPPREAVVSAFLPLGPLGQGGFAVQKLGVVAMRIFPKTHTLPGSVVPPGAVLYIVGYLVALVLWGFGLVWMFFAIATIRRSKFPFNMGWWGFTFPLGVFTTSTIQLGKETPSAFFRVLGTVFSIIVVLLWTMVAARTIYSVARGDLIFAPCLKEAEKLEAEDDAKHAAGKQKA